MNNISGGTISNKNNILESISNNKYFIGFMMIIINIGARFIIDELTPSQKKILNTSFFRKIIIFCAFFMATRDLLVSLTLTIIFVLFISNLFSEEIETVNKKDENINEIKIQMNDLNNKLSKI